MTTAAAETWTTRKLLAWMTDRFERGRLEAPRVVAEMLLAHVLDCERMRLYMDPERPATPDELARLRELVRRAARHEPVQYLVGRASFYGRELVVGDATQIPQPCTEELVGLVLAAYGAAGRRAEVISPDESELDEDGGVDEDQSPVPPPPPAPAPAPDILDLCTGSGCIAATLAAHLPAARIVATDVEPAAIELARANVERLCVTDRVELLVGSLYAPLETACPDRRFDWICANPPYIPDHEWEGDAVERAVREHVPARALRGGADGLDVIRPLLAGAPAWLRDGGRVIVEIGHDQGPAACACVEATSGLVEPEIRKDYEGFDRFVLARCTT